MQEAVAGRGATEQRQQEQELSPLQRQGASDLWDTVGVADRAASAEEVLASLRRDLERCVGGATKASSGRTHTCVIPSDVLVRLALLHPFLEQHHGSSTGSGGTAVVNPPASAATFLVNGAGYGGVRSAHDAASHQLSGAITDGAERHEVHEVLGLLLCGRLDAIAIDSAKLAFRAPSLSAVSRTTRIAVTPRCVRYDEELVMRRGTSSLDAIDQPPPTLTVATSWAHVPRTPPPTATDALRELVGRIRHCVDAAIADPTADGVASKSPKPESPPGNVVPPASAAIVTFRWS